jgi:PilZ domain
MVTLRGDSVRGHGRIDNLFLGGAAIASGAPVTRGEYLQLTITLPAEHAPIDVELAPVRKPHSFGVEFIRMSPTSLQILQHDIEHLKAIPKEPASATS